MITDLNLAILNREGNEYTFQGARGRSNVDVTLSTTRLVNSIRDWTVIKGDTSSDHLLICFHLHIQVVNSIDLVPNVRYDDRKINKPVFVDNIAKELRSTPPETSINGSAARITACMSKVCDQLLPRQSWKNKKT